MIPFGFLHTRNTGFTTITGLGTLEQDTTNGQYNSLAKIDDTHFILAYNGNGNDGFIKTFSVDGSYNITEIDVLEHDTGQGNFNSLVQIDSTHYALAYTSVGNNGFIKVFTIDGSYNITQTSSLEFRPSTFTSYNSLVIIDSTHLALAYGGDGSDGFITTFELDGSYNITELNTLEHDTINGLYNSLALINPTHLILAYAGDGNDGFIKTFSIDGSYDITEIDSLEHDTVTAIDNSLIKIDDTHFMLAYGGSGSDGFIKTFSIDGSYNITQIDSLEHNIFRGLYNSLVKVSDTIYALAFEGQVGADVGLTIKLFSINASYLITDIYELFSDTDAFITWTSMILLNYNHLAVAYSGLDADGYIKTYSLT